jgi:F0F1-type ATP synthase membrane subunit c/vacuolar-type H+-ATPase subunit K
MENASHGVTAFIVLLTVVIVVLGTAFGIGYLVGKLVI